MDIQKQIDSALELTKGITTLDHLRLTEEQRMAFRDIDCFADKWLRHQQSIISQQEIMIHQLRGALGYPVPGDIIEHPDIVNGIAQALEQEVFQQAGEIETLKQTLGMYADMIVLDSEDHPHDVGTLARHVLMGNHPSTIGECEQLLEGLREIDTHIRATEDPIPYIVDTLKNTLPEYKEE